MSNQLYRVRIAESAKDDLRRIGRKHGKKTYEIIRELIKGLEFDADKKGEPLQGSLRSLYSLHYSRFRIIYQVDGDVFTVVVVAVGWHESGSRSDVYKLIERAIEDGRLVIRKGGPPPHSPEES